MSELSDLRDHARARCNWQPGSLKVACKDKTTYGAPKPADHANCGGSNGDSCGCDCHRPTDKDRRMWRQIADEIEAYLGAPDEQESLFEEPT